MFDNQNLKKYIRENKTIFIVIAVALFLIELEIFALAAINSGKKSWLQIVNENGSVIHETDGNNLSEFNKYYFERMFGPFENYEVKLEIQDIPFPFRAWFVAALGVPIGFVLLLSFLIKVYLHFFYKSEKSYDDSIAHGKNTQFGLILKKINQMNIFVVGCVIFVSVIAYWIIPNTINYCGKIGIDTVIKFKLFFILIITAIIVIGMWIIYLRYLLAKRNIEVQVEIEKCKLQLKLDSNKANFIQLGIDHKSENVYLESEKI